MLDKIVDFGQQNQQGESSKMNGSQICIRRRSTKGEEERNTAENDQRSKRRRKNNEEIGKIHQLPNTSAGKCEKFTIFSKPL